MSNFKFNKKALMGAALLATAPTVKADGTERSSAEESKSQRGITHLTLDEAPLENITVCVPGKSMTAITGNFRYLPDKLAVVLNPFETDSVKMTFVVSHMTAMAYDRMLFLTYSQQLSAFPQIPTPKSINKLGLDLESLEIIGIYEVSSFGMTAQPGTRIWADNPAPRIKWEFDVKLNTLEILSMMNKGNDTIYVQAALMKKSDFEAEKWDSMILSEVDTIQFVPKCPQTMEQEEGRQFRVTEICADKEGIIGYCNEDGPTKSD